MAPFLKKSTAVVDDCDTHTFIYILGHLLLCHAHQIYSHVHALCFLIWGSCNLAPTFIILSRYIPLLYLYSFLFSSPYSFYYNSRASFIYTFYLSYFILFIYFIYLLFYFIFIVSWHGVLLYQHSLYRYLGRLISQAASFDGLITPSPLYFLLKLHRYSSALYLL